MYGTLRSAVFSPVSSLIADDIRWKGDASVEGKLYDIGNYPGAIPSKGNSIIRGELIEITDAPRILKILDRYEGCDGQHPDEAEYMRKRELVRLADGSVVEAWIYWYNLPVKGKRRIRNQDYLKYLRKKQLA